MHRICVLLVACFIAVPITAERIQMPEFVDISESGNNFLQTCKYTGDKLVHGHEVESFMCISFVTGFVQGITTSDEFHHLDNSQRMICFAAGATMVQGVRIIRKSIEDHPENAHFPTRRLAFAAFAKAFPCK